MKVAITVIIISDFTQIWLVVTANNCVSLVDTNFSLV